MDSGPYRTSPYVASETVQLPDHTWCPRCKAVCRLQVPWRGWRYARYAWFVTMGGILLLSPVLAADYVVMTPTALAIALAIGPLNHLAGQRPICRRCGLGFDPQ